MSHETDLTSDAPYSDSGITENKISLLVDASVVDFDLLRAALGNGWITYEEYSLDRHGTFADFIQSPPQSAENLRRYEVLRVTPSSQISPEQRTINAIEFNPFKVARISDELIIPNFTIPIRIYGSSNINDDEHWRAVCAGGIYRGAEYPGLVNTTELFYDTSLTVPLPYNRLELNLLYGAYGSATPKPEIEITNDYRHYYPSTKKYQDLAAATNSELLLPNIYEYETLYYAPNSDVGTAPQKAFAYESLLEQFGSASVSRITNLPNELGVPLGLSMFKVGRFQANSISGSGVETFQKTMVQTMEYPLTPEAERSIINRNKNILFDDYYYTTSVTDRGSAFRIARSFPYYNKIAFTRHVPTNTADMWDAALLSNVHSLEQATADWLVASMTGDDTTGMYEAMAARVISAHAHLSTLSTGFWGTKGLSSFFTQAIADSDMSNQFLESLKNLVLGEYAGIKMEERSYSCATQTQFPTGSRETFAIMMNGTVESKALKTVDFTQFMNYAAQHSTEAISTDVTSVGPVGMTTPARRAAGSRNATTNASSDRLMGAVRMSSFVPETLIPYLGRFFMGPFELAQETYGHSSVENPSHGSYQLPMYQAFFNQPTNYKEVVAYRIEKVGGYTTQDQTTTDVLQNYWIFNSNNAPPGLSFYDSQVKYGEEYTYNVYAYVITVGHRYKYGNLAISKKDQSITHQDVYGETDPDTPPLRHCLTFYNPATGEMAPQTFYDGKGLSQRITTSDYVGVVPDMFDDPSTGQANFVAFLQGLAQACVASGAWSGLLFGMFDWNGMWDPTGTWNPAAEPSHGPAPVHLLPTKWAGDTGFRTRYLNYLKRKETYVDTGGGGWAEDEHMNNFIQLIASPGRQELFIPEFMDMNPFMVGQARYEEKLLMSAGEKEVNSSPLAVINPAATSAQDISINPYIADCNLFIEPCAKLIEVPLFSKSLRVYDNPPNGVTTNPFQYLDNSQKVGFELNYDGYTADSFRFPEPITDADIDMREAYMNAKDFGLFNFKESCAQQRTLEVYQLDVRPSKYTDFANGLIATVDLKMNNSNYNQIKTMITNTLELNKKYYYVFRFVNENGVPGYPSSILEAELINDGGYTYARFDTMLPEEMEIEGDHLEQKTLKRLMQIVPTTQQLQLDDSAINYEEMNAEVALRSGLIKVGPAITAADDSASIWGKTFKIRLISKKSGKKIDLNITYNVGKDLTPAIG